MNIRLQITILVLLCAIVSCNQEHGTETTEAEPTAAPIANPSTGEIMRNILRNLQVALPLSTHEETFSNPANREKITLALAALADAAEVLESHKEDSDAQTQFLARSIGRDARNTLRQFKEEHYTRSAFLLQQITENCIVCHTRLESTQDSDFSRNLIPTETLEAMDIEPRISLEIATRRFDDALNSLEELLTSPQSPALMLGPLADYLVISIRVKNNYERPLPVLRQFSNREDVWNELREDVDRWIEALPQLKQLAESAPTLETARSMIEEGDTLDPTDGPHSAGLAHYVVASSILEEIIAENTEPQPELGESFYLLGIVESRIGRNYWVTPAPFLLETSIRLGPKEAYAREAFSVLEHEMSQSYEGTSVDTLPEEDRKHLEELRALINP